MVGNCAGAGKQAGLSKAYTALQLLTLNRCALDEHLGMFSLFKARRDSDASPGTAVKDATSG